MAQKNYKTTETMLAQGKLLEEFGKTDFLTVTYCAKIDRVRWSAVKIGSKGKDVLDFYMKAEDMLLLCMEIDSVTSTAAKKIEADKDSKYPKAYEYVTGKKGEKKLAIGGGQKGVRVQLTAPVNGNSKYKVIAISFRSLQLMAIYFKHVYGVLPSSYQMEANVRAFWKWNESQKAFSLGSEDEESEDTDSTSNSTDKQEANSNNAPTPSKEESTEAKPTSPVAKTMTLFACTKCEKKDDGKFYFDAKIKKKDGSVGKDVFTVVLDGNSSISKDDYIAFTTKLNEVISGGLLLEKSIEYTSIDDKHIYLVKFA